MSEKDIVNWIGRDGDERNVSLSALKLMHEIVSDGRNKKTRAFDLEGRFHSTYEAAISSGAGIVDAIAKAKDAVKTAGVYDEAMKQAVEARLNAEFPE